MITVLQLQIGFHEFEWQTRPNKQTKITLDKEKIATLIKTYSKWMQKATRKYHKGYQKKLSVSKKVVYDLKKSLQFTQNNLQKKYMGKRKNF